MRYTVIWSPEALGKLADLWSGAADREAISRSAEAIERSLRDDPDRRGEDYYGDRLLVEVALAVAYRVIEEDGIADIFDVWSRSMTTRIPDSLR
jgi:plasmid stabilization system protein ParE